MDENSFAPFGIWHRRVGRQQADEDLQDLELYLDALRDDVFECVEDLLYKGLLAENRSQPRFLAPATISSLVTRTLGTALAMMSLWRADMASAMTLAFLVLAARKMG